MKFHNTSGKSAAPQKTVPSHGNVSELPTAHGNVHPTPSAANAALPHPGKGKSQIEFTYVNSPPIPIEPLVTKKTLCEHYHMALRTLDYAIALGLPKVKVGALVRFRFSEVQPWFEKNGYRRFASEGRRAAVEKALLKSKQFQFALDGGVQITSPNNKPKSPKTKPKKRK